MELTYQSPLMPASYTAISADEMTYIDGGAIQIGKRQRERLQAENE